MDWKGKHKETYQGAVIDCDPNTRDSIIAIYGDDTLSHGWFIRYGDERITKTDASFWGIVRDNLLEEPLTIRISTEHGYQRHRNSWLGKLHGFYLTGDQNSVVKNGRVYSLFLNVEWVSERPPSHLSDIFLKIKGSVISETHPEKYSLGYCDKLSARVETCTPSTYLKLGGTVNNDGGISEKTCKLFQLVKGHPHQYCSIKLGT
jgi:hypothetical protein